MNLSAHLAVSIRAAIDAGQTILDIRARSFHVEHKTDGSPVTDADLAADSLIRERLSAAFPEIPQLTEETADSAARLSAADCFIVDPLDGTREFVKQNGEFTVNIALVHDHRPVVGVIYAPCLDQLWYAAEGIGVFRVDSASQRSDSQLPEAAKPIHVSTRTKNLTLLVSRTSLPTVEAKLDNLPGVVCVQPTSSSLKGCRIAEGSADVSICNHGTYEWDTAAMQCIAAEAGAILRFLDGSEIVYNRSNPHNEQGHFLCNRPENLKIVDKLLGL
ncbi:MAG: 3'(2'),5'-bisphosphate nucleotidase CysQ [Clostridia bacterium]|nr:3'(2'),5'-bisphosphate nucleotidase CysQ [Clostridia bacterium]